MSDKFIVFPALDNVKPDWRRAMKKDGFFAEALSAVVAHRKKKAKEGSPNLFLDQKK